MPTPEYLVQPFHPGSYPLLKALFRAAFNAPLEKSSFAKKYDTKELGHGVIGFLAVHAATQTPAAFYGVFPVTVLMGGKEVLAAQSGDTMTHPAHQRKGLFVRLAQMTYEECRKAGVQLVFGQPNKNSYHGLVNKLHFLPLEDIERFDLKLRIKTFPLPKLCQKAGLFKHYLRFAKRFLKNKTVRVPAFVNPAQTSYGKVLRNAAYLRYKEEGDKAFIRLGDVTFWLKFTDVLWLGDASDYEAVTPAVINKLKRLAAVLGYNTVTFHVNKSLPQPAFLQTFKKVDAEASCFLYLDDERRGQNLLLTGADFDTW